MLFYIHKENVETADLSFVLNMELNAVLSSSTVLNFGALFTLHRHAPDPLTPGIVRGIIYCCA